MCGQPARRPDRFSAHYAYSDTRAAYHIDLEQGLVRRVISNAVQPVSFFVLNRQYLSQPVQGGDTQASPKRRVRWRWLKVGLGSVAAVAILLLLYPLYPGAEYQTRELVAKTLNNSTVLAEAPAQISAANEVIIPKIGVRTKILEAPSLKILDREEGVWHQTGDLSRNFVLAGHRFKYLPPNSSTLYNLGQLTAGDSVIIDYQGRRTIYAVSEVLTVPEGQVEILNQDGDPRLTIYTCSDKRQTHRIVVRAMVVP